MPICTFGIILSIKRTTQIVKYAIQFRAFDDKKDDECCYNHFVVTTCGNRSY